MTGTGKTTLARLLVRRYRQVWGPGLSVYILDSKASGDFAGWPGQTDGAAPPSPLKGQGKRGQSVQVWTPGQDDRGAYDAWFGGILHSHKHERPALVFVDELSSIGGRSGSSYPANFTRLQKQGRGLSIALITLTQEMAEGPRQVLGQATHIVRLGLLDDYDARRVDSKLWGASAGRREPPLPYGFHYARADRPGLVRTYTGARDFFAGKDADS